MKSRLKALAGALALALTGVGHAALVPLDQPLTLFRPAGLSLAFDSGGSGHAAGYHELVVDPSWTELTRFTSFQSGPAGSAVSYALYADLAATARASAPGALRASWSQSGVPAGAEVPFYTYLLGAGQYVLEIGMPADSHAVSTRVSQVPLPGAAWLFGSALLAFLWISGRHRL